MGLNFGTLKGGPAALASYDFVDLASGTGMVVYYLGNTFENGVSGAYLTKDPYYSNHVIIGKSYAASGSVFEMINDFDFDLVFNLPQTIKGNVIVNIPVGINEIVEASFRQFLHVKLRKWDGTNEIEIADASGAILLKASGGVGTYGYSMDSIKLTTPLTHFKKGETLRVTLEQWGMADDPQLPEKTGYFFIGNDPKGRATTDKETYTFGTEPSIATVQIPFKLDT